MFPTSSLVIALALVLAPQDGKHPQTQAKPEDAAAKRASIVKTIAAALRNTPGTTVIGSLDRDSPFAGLGIAPSIGGGLVGKVHASLDKNGVVYAVVDAQDGKLEIWHKNKRTAQRFTWSGDTSPRIGTVAAELVRLFDFGRVRRQLEDADKVKKTSVRTISGRQCQGYSAVFEPDLVASGDAGGLRVQLDVEKVEGKFWLDVQNGALARADFDIVSGLPPTVRIGVGGGGGQAPEMRFETKYSFVVKSADPELTHKIPAEIDQKLSR